MHRQSNLFALVQFFGLIALLAGPGATPVSAYDAEVVWRPAVDPQEAASGYFLYADTQPGSTNSPIDVGMPSAQPDGTLVYTLVDLPLGPTTYVSVASYDDSSAEIARSQEMALDYAAVASVVDSDGDGLTDAQEDVDLDQVVDAGESDPFDVDSDGDGLEDGDEVNVHGTDPADADSDGDGYSDGQEISDGSDPNDENSHAGTLACGNGILDAGEECDDSNSAGGDGCGPTCQVEFCGDGIVNNVDEECDPPGTGACDGSCRLFGVIEVTQQGAIIARVPNPTGGGNLDIEVIRDGDEPPVGSTQSNRQFDTWDGSNQASDDWMGYSFGQTREFVRVEFQEGKHFSDGGWFESVTVQVRDGGVWREVSGLQVTPPYPGVDDGVFFESYDFEFAPATGDAVRVFGVPGGASDFISVAELRVFAAFGQTAVCGDGVLDAGEECDDGNGDNSDACLDSCTAAQCGDGFVRTGVEACDDGVANSDAAADACRTDCSLPRCGDGVTDSAETCDDGNVSDTDSCLNTCAAAACGDGLLWVGVEECDDGAGNDDASPDACRSSCVLASCGDGVVDGGEVCDDGNTQGGDACPADCVTPSCGNGVVEPGEECDEGAGNSDANPQACRTDCLLHDVCGDVTNDGVLTVSDALEVLLGAIGERECAFSLCDTNGDGNVSPVDGLRIVRAAVGLEVEMDCGLLVTLVLDDDVSVGAMTVAVEYSATGSTFIGERGDVRCANLLPGAPDVFFDNDTAVSTLVVDLVNYQASSGPLPLAECRFLAGTDMPDTGDFVIEVLDYPGMAQSLPAPLVWLDY